MLFLLFGFSLQLAIAQSEINYWPILAKVTYKKEYDDLLGIKIDKPIFSPELRSLEGKAIQIKGYIIPTDGYKSCLLYTSPSPRDRTRSRMPSSA